jgi:hypothetical protein
MGVWRLNGLFNVPRGVFSGLLMGLMALVLTACSAGSILTDSNPSPGGEASGKPVPPIAIQQITGVPPGKLSELKTALSAAGRQHAIGFVEGNFGAGVFALSGDVRISSEPAGVRLVYQFQFRDADGVLIGNIDGEDNAGVFAGADPWAAVTPAIMERIARRTADAMARKLAGMGYAARLAALTAPPSELFARAGSGAGREIDFETVNGPGFAALGNSMFADADKQVEHEEIAPSVASLLPLPGEGQMPKVAVSDQAFAAAPPADNDTGVDVGEPSVASANQSEEAQPPPAKLKPGQRAIRAVAVVPVQGSPGPGDAELTAAMRKTLSSAGWPVVSKPQADALTIEGRVKLTDKGSGKQSVAVNWEVKSPDGKTLGDVKQANEIPKGALDGGWGDAAFSVSEAAAPGIFDVVKRYR